MHLMLDCKIQEKENLLNGIHRQGQVYTWAIPSLMQGALPQYQIQGQDWYLDNDMWYQIMISQLHQALEQLRSEILGKNWQTAQEKKSRDGFYDITKTWFDIDHDDSQTDNNTDTELLSKKPANMEQQDYTVIDIDSSVPTNDIDIDGTASTKINILFLFHKMIYLMKVAKKSQICLLILENAQISHQC